MTRELLEQQIGFPSSRCRQQKFSNYDSARSIHPADDRVAVQVPGGDVHGHHEGQVRPRDAQDPARQGALLIKRPHYVRIFGPLLPLVRIWYRVTLVVEYLVWVDIDLACPPPCFGSR